MLASTQLNHKTLVIGSAKSCFSHTEGAAGFTGMLLAMQVLHRCCYPPVLHLRTISNYVATAVNDWQAFMVAAIPRQSCSGSSHPETAGTSSFGMGGTNAHVLIRSRSSRTSQSLEYVWQLARCVTMKRRTHNQPISHSS